MRRVNNKMMDQQAIVNELSLSWSLVPGADDVSDQETLYQTLTVALRSSPDTSKQWEWMALIAKYSG